MREIKFKAWIFAAEYRFGIKLHIGQEKDVINIDFKNQKLSVLGDDGKAQEYALYDDNVYIAQYTGYKDGNGVEIYTGHVVTYFYKGLRCLGKILLHEGKFTIVPTWFVGNDTSSDRGVILGLHEILAQKSSYLEVANHICRMIDRKISDK